MSPTPPAFWGLRQEKGEGDSPGISQVRIAGPVTLAKLPNWWSPRGLAFVFLLDYMPILYFDF